jgi:hypothetical protein
LTKKCQAGQATLVLYGKQVSSFGVLLRYFFSGFSLGGTTWSFANSTFDFASATWHESMVGNTSCMLEQALGKPVTTWPKRSLMCSQVEWVLQPACSRVLSVSGQHFSNVSFGNRIPAFSFKTLCMMGMYWFHE